MRYRLRCLMPGVVVQVAVIVANLLHYRRRFVVFGLGAHHFSGLVLRVTRRFRCWLGAIQT